MIKSTKLAKCALVCCINEIKLLNLICLYMPESALTHLFSLICQGALVNKCKSDPYESTPSLYCTYRIQQIFYSHLTSDCWSHMDILCHVLMIRRRLLQQGHRQKPYKSCLLNRAKNTAEEVVLVCVSMILNLDNNRVVLSQRWICRQPYMLIKELPRPVE